MRPSLNDGDPLAKVGDVGAAVGAYHVHYCVTTGPDRSIAAPFESVPVAFRNYSMSRNGGAWQFVAAGTPRAGDLVRREARAANAVTSPAINPVATPLNFGSVSGTIIPADGGHGVSGGRFTITVVSAWGEPISGESVVLSSVSARGPWTYRLDHVPDYRGVRVVVNYEGGWSATANLASGQSGAFDLKANQSASVGVSISGAKRLILN